MIGLAQQRGRRFGAALCAFALLALPIAEAADLGVEPVRIELSAEQQTAAIKISNASDAPASIQIQAVVWSQIDGKDVYTPTRELLVAPPIVTIAPKGEQVIRTALRRPADPSNELAYRIFLRELPAPPPPGYKGLQVALRIGLPVFVKPQHGQAAPKMVWSVAHAPDNHLKATLFNQGNAHVRVSDFVFYVSGSDQPIAGEAGSTYVLAGQSRSWLVKKEHPAKTLDARLRLKAHTDAGDVDVELAAEMP